MGTPIAQCKGNVAGVPQASGAGPFDTIRRCTDSVPPSCQHAAVPFPAQLRPSLSWGRSATVDTEQSTRECWC